MNNAHTDAILNGDPIYLTGKKTQISVSGTRSYTHRIKVHKRRSIKTQLVKDELNFQAEKTRKLKQYIETLKNKPNVLQRLIQKIRKRG